MRSKPDPVDQPERTAHIQYYSTETVLLIFPLFMTDPDLDCFILQRRFSNQTCNCLYVTVAPGHAHLSSGAMPVKKTGGKSGVHSTTFKVLKN